jgi:hypothetical protein
VTRLTVVPLRSSPSQETTKTWAALCSSCKNKSFLGVCLLTVAHYRGKSPRIRIRRLKLSRQFTEPEGAALALERDVRR